MKYIFIILSLLSFACYGQNTESSNSTIINVVRNNPLTPARVANALDALNLSKQGFISELVAGGTDTYTLTANVAVTSYITNLSLNVRFTNANATTSPTINVNGLGAKAIKLSSGASLDVGDISAGGAYILRYNGTDFRMLGPAVGGGGVPQCPIPLTTYNATHTLVAGDQCNLIGTIRMDLTNVADVIVPLHSSVAFDDDQVFQLYQVGDSAFTINPAGGVNVVNLSGGSLTSLGKGSVMVLIQWDEDEWDLLSSSASGGTGSLNFATNGLIKDADTVRLGGTLNQNTEILGDGNNLSILDLGVVDIVSTGAMEFLSDINVGFGGAGFDVATNVIGMVSSTTMDLNAQEIFLRAQTGAKNILLQAFNDITLDTFSGDDIILNAADDIRLNPTGAVLLGASSGASGQVFTSQGSSSPPIWTTRTADVVGTTTNNNATAGNLAEEIKSVVSTYTNYTTTATYQNITSITLTAGDWDISALFTYSSNSSTITAGSNGIFVISTTTASAAGSTEGVNISYVPQAALLGTSKFTDAITPYRVSLSGTTTYYLNTQATFTLGNPQFVGSIRARRMR